MRSKWGVLAGLALLAAAGAAYLVTNETASALTTVAGFAVVGLSVLLVTGLAGELSLGQFAFAGIGAAVSLHVAAATGNFFTGAVAGCAAAAASAVLVGLPALRLRGIALAATTLAFALAAEAWLLRLPWLLGDGVSAPKPVWTGYALVLAKDYYLFALLMLVLALWLAHRLRAGGFGRVVLALRDNEDAARALGVPAPRRKLQVYAAAGALAGLGGVVIGHGQTQVTVNSFPAAAGIDVVALTVVGGLGLLGGSILGALLLVGLPGLMELGIFGQAALTLGWLLVVVVMPGGLGEPLSRLVGRLPGGRYGPRSRAAGRRPGGWGGRMSGLVGRLPGGLVRPAGRPGTSRAGVDRRLVSFAGRDVTGLSPQRRAGLGLVRSFQDARLFPTLTVRESLLVAGERLAPTGLLTAALGGRGPQRRQEALAGDLLDLFGLTAYADRQVGELSTGTRRTVELACLLALEPSLLLLDEPSSGVSQADGVALADLLQRVNRELGVALLVIEHDLLLLSRLATRMVAMDSGRIIADGTPDQVRTHPAVVAAYLGTDAAAVHRSGAPV